MYRSFLDVDQHLQHWFDIFFSRCFSDSRGREDLIGTVDTARVDKPRRADRVYSYWLNYQARLIWTALMDYFSQLVTRIRDQRWQRITSNVDCKANSDSEAWRFDERDAAYTDVGVQQTGRIRDQSLAQRAAKVAMTQPLDTGIMNKKKPRIDLVGGACRMRVYVPGYDTVAGRTEWSSYHTRSLVSLWVREWNPPSSSTRWEMKQTLGALRLGLSRQKRVDWRYQQSYILYHVAW